MEKDRQVLLIANVLFLNLLIFISSNIRSLSAQEFDPLSSIVVLDQKLRQAACDPDTLSKAPSLEALKIIGKKENIKNNQDSETFLVQLPKEISEQKLISFLLGDESSFVASEAIKVSSDKFKISELICNSMLNSKALDALLSRKPSVFLNAQIKNVNIKLNKNQIEIFDPEARFGVLTKRSLRLIGGWIEPYEVISARIDHRIYRRVTNLLTNQTQSIELLTSDGLLIGSLYLSKEPSPQDWLTYKSWAETPIAREAQIDSYRQNIEYEAMRALKKNPKSSKELRNLQDFYKNILQAYRLFPENKQFDVYKNKHQSRQIAFESLDKIIHQYLDNKFLEQLANAKVNGSNVRLGLFKPDAKLFAIYSEYLEKLARIKP